MLLQIAYVPGAFQRPPAREKIRRRSQRQGPEHSVVKQNGSMTLRTAFGTEPRTNGDGQTSAEALRKDSEHHLRRDFGEDRYTATVTTRWR